MGKQGGASLRERNRQRTAFEIGAATVALVAERGFDDTRVEDICDAAGIGRSTFFRYFDSKDDSFVSGLYDGRLEAVMGALDAAPPGSDAVAAVSGAFLRVVEEQWEEQRVVLELEARIRADSRSVQARASAEQLRWQDAIADALRPRLVDALDDRLEARIIAAGALTVVRSVTATWLEGPRTSPVPLLEAGFAAMAKAMNRPATAVAARTSRRRGVAG